MTCYSVHAGKLTPEVMFHLRLLYAGCLQKFYSPSLLLTDTVLYGLPEMEEMLSKYNLNFISLNKSFRQIVYNILFLSCGQGHKTESEIKAHVPEQKRHFSLPNLS